MRRKIAVLLVTILLLGSLSYAQQATTYPRKNLIQASITLSASTTETTLISANAVRFVDLAYVLICNTSAATQTRVDFRSATGGSVIFSINSAGNSCVSVDTIPAIITQAAVNNNWTAQCSVATTDVRIYAIGVLQ